MTILMMRRAACTMVTVALAGATCPVSLAAQAGPPVAKAPRDTLPAAKQLRSPSPPPSAVAPQMRSRPRPAGAVVSADSGPAPVRRVGAPVDSVKPAEAPPRAVPRPLQRQDPPPPPAKTTRGVTASASAPAALRSDEPPPGATGRCKDGTWLTGGEVTTGACSSNGGLAVRLPQKSAPRPPNP